MGGGATGLGHGLHHLHDFQRDRRIQHLPGLVALALDEGRRDQLAAVAERGVSHRDLQRRGRQAVAIGHGLLGGAAPARRQRQHPGRLAGEAAAGLLAVAELVQEVVITLVGQLRDDLGGADIGAFGDDTGGVEHAVISMVGGPVAAVRRPARVGVNAGMRGDHAGLERRRHGQRLHRRTRLDHVGDRAVAMGVGVTHANRVRVVGRQVGHRQHFAGGDVEHHRRAAAGAGTQQRAAQLSMGEELDATVDREREVLARFGRLDQVDTLDDAALTIADNTFLTWFAAQPVVERQLEAFLAAVVDIGEAQDVRHRLTLRVEAAVFALREHARDVVGEDLARLVRIDAALEVHKLLARALVELVHQVVGRHSQCLGQLRDARRVLQQFLRVAPHRLDRRRHRQRLTVAVGDHAARGRDRDLPQRARIALLQIEIVVVDLHVERPSDQRQRAQSERAADQQQPVAQVEARAVARRAIVVAEQRLQRQPGGRLAVAGTCAIAGIAWLADALFHGPRLMGEFSWAALMA